MWRQRGVPPRRGPPPPRAALRPGRDRSGRALGVLGGGRRPVGRRAGGGRQPDEVAPTARGGGVRCDGNGQGWPFPSTQIVALVGKSKPLAITCGGFGCPL